MRRSCRISFAGILFLTACSDIKKPSDGNFRKAIDEYLAKHGRACTWIGRPFPIDISEARQKVQYGTGSQMTTLEQAGLVHSSNVVVATPGIFGADAPRPVKRYEPTNEGKKYLQQSPGAFGPITGFCYGEKTVDSIVKWTEPVATGVYSQTEVTYTYKIQNLASWAQRPDVQSAFGDVKTTVIGVSKLNEIAGLQLTNRGWEAPGQ